MVRQTYAHVIRSGPTKAHRRPSFHTGTPETAMSPAAGYITSHHILVRQVQGASPGSAAVLAGAAWEAGHDIRARCSANAPSGAAY